MVELSKTKNKFNHFHSVKSCYILMFAYFTYISPTFCWGSTSISATSPGAPSLPELPDLEGSPELMALMCTGGSTFGAFRFNGLTKKGKSIGNHRFSHEIWYFPVIFPLNQSIESFVGVGGFVRWILVGMGRTMIYLSDEHRAWQIGAARLVSRGYIIEGSLEAKLPTIWRDENGTARKKLGRGESQQGKEKR